MLDDKLVTL